MQTHPVVSKGCDRADSHRVTTTTNPGQFRENNKLVMSVTGKTDAVNTTGGGGVKYHYYYYLYSS
jgi:hypothetical protein